MKFSYENLEIWQLGMRLVDLVYSFKDRFLPEDKFGLWDQLVRAAEAIPRDIAEGYGKSSKKERALYMERAKTEAIEVDTSFKEAVKKGRIKKEECENLVKPLIKELYFKIIAYRKWLLGAPKRSDQPSAAINQAQRSTNSPTGFTLIEILIVVFLLGIIVIIGSNLFFSILKGASKAEIEKEVKQNGDYAMNIMERMVRNAQRIDDCSSGNSIKITNPDGYQTEFKCVPGDGVTKIASNSSPLTGENVTLGNSCDERSLLFSCDTTRTPPVVTISFNLSQKGTDVRPEERAEVRFQTTVSLRTY